MKKQESTPPFLFSFTSSHYLASVIFIAAFLLTGCATQRGPGADNASDNEAVIMVEDAPPYGQYLITGNGRSLYMFTADNRYDSSNCYDQCAEVWPPVLAEDPIAASPAVDSGKLGTIERKDGSMQVTYNGWPLYHYEDDQGVSGHNERSFGGEWYLMGPEGQEIEV